MRITFTFSVFESDINPAKFGKIDQLFVSGSMGIDRYWAGYKELTDFSNFAALGPIIYLSVLFSRPRALIYVQGV